MTAASLSVMAGWQRGGFVTERVLMISVGVVLVIAAHLLPALVRPFGARIRMLGAVLWIGCMAATCYGHAVFFMFAQQHAGDVRAAAVPTVDAPRRNLAEIAAYRAPVVARLARLAERDCRDRCAPVRIESVSLTAKRDALDAERDEVTRRELAADRADAARAAAKADPVAGMLTAFGVTASHVDLVAGLAFAAVLEGVACFCWLLAVRPEPAPVKAVTPVAPISQACPVVLVAPVSSDAVAVDTTTDPTDAYVTDVLAAVRAGTLKPTINDIRVFIRRSQTTAKAVRERVLAVLNNTAA
ncbi:hypothetical protein [Paraburkholderia sp.]|uniref:hypothetical protein n=1 Tax=Paraburkholderia sp. TaxID=1926495 RepID=UPI00239CFDB9|nr:hypothetical protein [Paraburkholderia sp.]MDE1179446.1 hypothetical protein [Paraburkholderia sp.]